ncbi:hypothetical protein HYH02_012674 [Chlamydomonas schloesseri]|uniref:Uncharacterized protein n=1 Tax=Chlamydomonas schloesseri TaxID=2026947 RepID=A0A835VY38_9CHLO|nr:hypothetical protein HYH02_012674 [Chlamydomonas schloesseri]|eukprot:KAG2433557.1 hypothetical protein HYH02_012674 [Chlamydomonas schloesseri]
MSAQCATNATWEKLPFIPGDTTPGFSPTQWSQQQFVSYAKGPLLSATSVNLAFFCVVLALLALFLLWRSLRCVGWCCSRCCGNHRLVRRKSLLSYEVMHDPWMRGYKVMYVFFAIGSIALAAVGMALLPRAADRTADLAVRLDVAGDYVGDLLTASDSLISGGAGLRPLMSDAAALLTNSLPTTSLAADMTCTGGVLDTALAAPSQPSDLRTALLAADTALRTAVGPALTAAAALLDATAGRGAAATIGATPALAAVASAPALVSNIRSGLSTYDSALGGLPATRSPTSSSDPRVSDLQAAQAALALTAWIDSIDYLYDSVRVTAAAARQMPYTRLATALSALRAPANATSASPLTPLAAGLGRLDAAYLGTAPQQAAGVVTAGRACLARLRTQLAAVDDAVFSFNAGTLERAALGAVPSIQAALEAVYGNANVSAVVAGGSAAAGSPAAVAAPAMAWPQAALSVLSPFVEMDDAAIAAACGDVQAVLSNVTNGGANGTSKLPDEMPTLSYLTSLRAALVALQAPAGNVSAALSTYAGNRTDANYGSLRATSNSTRNGVLTNARSAAGAPSPSGYNTIVSAAANATDLMASAALQVTLATLESNASSALTWLAASTSAAPATPGMVHLNVTTAALAALQSTFTANSARLATANWTSTTTSSATTANATTSSPGYLPSAFLEPLGRSLALIGSVLSNGLSAIGEQLDNALGKVLMPPPPPASSRPPTSPNATTTGYHRRAILASTTTTTSMSSAGLNATAQVRQQLVSRLHNLTDKLTGSSSKQFTDGAYWGPIAIYAAVISTCLLLGLAVFLNWPGGLVVLFMLHLFVSGVVLAAAWGSAASLVVAHDTCGSVDSIVLAEVSPSSALFPLVRYYLQGVGGSLPAVLRASGLGDTSRLSAAAALLQTQVLDPLLLPSDPSAPTAAANATSFATTQWPGSLGSVQYGLGGLLADLSVAAADMSAHLSDLLTLGERNAVLGVYYSVTSWACCGLAGDVMIQWVCTTGCGVLAWATALVALLILKNLDDMPGGGGVCGCTCYRARDFPRPQRGRRAGASSGGGAAACSASAASAAAAPGADVEWGKGAPYMMPPPMMSAPNKTKEVLVENGLFQGPPPSQPPMTIVMGDGTVGTSGHRPSINVCVMDPETAAAFGLNPVSEGGASSAPSAPSAPLAPPPQGNGR